jgi:Tfp pilus assembly protein PilO
MFAQPTPPNHTRRKARQHGCTPNPPILCSRSSVMNGEPWHLDRRVPVALILTMVLQIAGFAWAVSAINSQVQTNTRDIEKNTVVIEQIRNASQTQAIQLGRIEENITGLRADIGRLLQKLEAR